MDSRFAQCGVEHVARPDRIRSPHVVVHDRHRDGPPDAGRITPHQVRRAVGDAVREGGVRGEIGLALVRLQIAPLTQGRVVAGERVVRPCHGNVAAHGPVQRSRDA